jgi:serine/threonine protein kinase
MLLEGQQLAQYCIIQRLRSGGMGEVYLALDENLHRHIAIKVIQTDYSHYPDDDAAEEAVRLFLREMQAVAQLEHPNILPVYDSGEEYIDDLTLMFMVMPFREEGSLADWLRAPGKSRILWPRDACPIVKQAASALQCAHNNGILHQDVKPSNFLIQDEAEDAGQLNLQLADFGVAKFMTTTNESRTIRGTPMYMAPEQWEGHPCPETDQYALAVMAYELLTGHPPFMGSNQQQMWHQHRHIPPKPPSTINPRLPQNLDTVLLRALAKNPTNRYRSMAAFAQAFERAVRNGSNIIPINPGEEVVPLEGTSTFVPTHPVTNADNIVPLSPYKKNDRRRKYILVFSLLLPLILIFGSVGIISYLNTGQTATHKANGLKSNTPSSKYTATANTTTAANNTATAQTHATNVAQSTATAQAANANANATATTTAQINATATAQTASANATASAEANATATVYASAVANGAPIINDPLKDNSQNYNWDTTNIQGGGGCAFAGGAYHASMPQTGYISACFAQATNFSNFSYQIQMTIIKGDQGGIVFRADPSKGSFYYFHISTSGAYALETYSNYNPSRSQPLIQGTSPAIKTGLNQTNLIAVVANGNGLKFFVNMQQIASVSDGTYNGGKIGVIAEDISNPTEVVFRNIVVWPL